MDDFFFSFFFFLPFQNFKVLFIEHVKLYISLLLSNSTSLWLFY